MKPDGDYGAALAETRPVAIDNAAMGKTVVQRTPELDAQLVELIEAHQRILRGICRAAFPLALHDQDDLYQEITIRALHAYPSFEHRSKFSTWLRRVAYNTVSVWRRDKEREEKRLKIELCETISELPGEPPVDVDPDGRIARLFAHADLLDRFILDMMLAGEDNDTIADTLRVKPDAIRKRLERLKKRIINS